MADEDWTGQKEDYENSGATYLTGIWRGVDSAYIAPALALPPGFAEGECPPPTTGTQSVAPAAAPLMPRCRHCGSADICRDANAIRSEERRVGKECGRTGRARWAPEH